MAQLTDMLAEKVYDVLVAALQTPYSDEDPTYAEVVKVGLLQDNPLKNGISVTIHLGDPDEVDQDSWIDEVAKDGDPQHPFAPFAEVGGNIIGLHWWRRGTVKAECFFIKSGENRDEAREYANIIKGRIERNLALSANDFVGIVDEFGEKCIQFFPAKSYAREQGGPNQHIWRVYVWWQALTFRS
jgi:hypothetical protein